MSTESRLGQLKVGGRRPSFFLFEGQPYSKQACYAWEISFDLTGILSVPAEPMWKRLLYMVGEAPVL